VKRKKSVGSHSDLNETGIFVFLTLVIFFVAVGFPTLINTSPTLGYEGVEWTPVTSFYQEAYAQQQLMETLAFSNYNPIVLSAFLVMPTAIDNPPPDPIQYFELKYSQLIQIDTGFIPFETIKQLFTEPIPKAYAIHNSPVLEQNQWQFREHRQVAITPVHTITTNATDGDLIVRSGVNQGTGYLFKCFNPDEVSGKVIRYNFESYDNIGTNPPTSAEVEFFDGCYDASSLTDFVDLGSRVIKGVGNFYTASRCTLNNAGSADVWEREQQFKECIIPNTTTSTEGNVTIFVNMPFTSGRDISMEIRSIEIEGMAEWFFNHGFVTNYPQGGGNNNWGIINVTETNILTNQTFFNPVGEWQFKEHDRYNDQVAVCMGITGGLLHIQTGQTGSGTSGVCSGHRSGAQGDGYLFHVFDKEDIAGKEIKMSVEGNVITFGGGGQESLVSIEVRDGEYRRGFIQGITNPTAVPTHFPEANPIITIGAGRLDNALVNFTITSATIDRTNADSIFRDDFREPFGWSQALSHYRIDPVRTVMDIDFVNDASGEHGLIFDLGAPLDDTAWVMRIPLNFSGVQAETTAHTMKFYISDVSTFDSLTTPQDHIGWTFNHLASGSKAFYESFGDAEVPTANEAIVTADLGLGFEGGLEVIRDSATSVTWNFYGDKDFNNLINTTSSTIASTTDALAFIKITGETVGGATAGVSSFDIPYIEIWNSTTTISEFLHIPASAIDYASSTEDKITVMLKMTDEFDGSSWRTRIHDIKIEDPDDSNDFYFWNFTALETVPVSGQPLRAHEPSNILGEDGSQLQSGFADASFVDGDQVWYMKEHAGSSGDTDIQFINRTGTLELNTMNGTESGNSTKTGSAILMKNFPRSFLDTDLDGFLDQNVTVTAEGFQTGTGTIPFDIKLRTGILKLTDDVIAFPSGGGLGGTEVGCSDGNDFSLTVPFASTTMTCSNSTSLAGIDDVTLMIILNDTLTTGGARVKISEVTIGEKLWDFSNDLSTKINFDYGHVMKQSDWIDQEIGFISTFETILPPPFNLDGLETYWQFEETTGNTFNSDLTNIFPNGNSTTTNFMIKTNTGVIGNAWNTNGTDNEPTMEVGIGGVETEWRFMIANAPDDDGDFSLNYWMRDFDCSENNEQVFDTTDGTQGVDIRNQCGGASSFTSITIAGTSGTITENSGDGYVDKGNGTYSMYTITHDNDDNEIVWYRNGTELVRVDPTDITDGVGGSTSTPNLFNQHIGNIPVINATFDEFSIWSRVLSGVETDVLFNNGAGLDLNTVSDIANNVQINQTITDTATVQETVTITKGRVHIDNLLVYYHLDDVVDVGDECTNERFTDFRDGADCETLVQVVDSADQGLIGGGLEMEPLPATVPRAIMEEGFGGDFCPNVSCIWNKLVDIDTGALTFNFWLADIADTGTVEPIIVFFPPSGNKDGIRIQANTAGSASSMTFQMFNSNGVEFGHTTPDGYIDLDSPVYSMYTIVMNRGLGQAVEFYKNGVLFSNTTNNNWTCTGAVPTANGCFMDSALTLFSDLDSPMNSCQECRMDELAIWNRNLTASNVLSLYNNGNGLLLENQQFFDITDLEAYWQFEETSGTLNVTQSVSNIDDADSSGDAGITKTNTGILGNAWRTDSSIGTKVNITGTATDWNFAIQNSSSFNFWITQADPTSGDDSGRLFTTENPIALSNGMRIIFDYVAERIFYLIQEQGIIKANESSPSGFIDTSCRPTCTAFTMYTITINDTSGEIKWYSNGTLQETDTGATFSTLDNSLTPVLFGNPLINFGNLNLATTDELSVWSRVLTDSEIENIFNGSNALDLSQFALQVAVTTNVTLADTVTISDQVIPTKFNVADINTWQGREHDVNVGGSPSVNWFANSTDNSLVIEHTQGLGRFETFKSFANTTLDGQTIAITWKSFEGGTDFPPEVQVFDGIYDRNNATQFPEDSNKLSIGAGQLTNCVGEPSTPISLSTFDCLLSTTGSTTGNATLFITYDTNNGINSLEIHAINITNIGIWNYTQSHVIDYVNTGSDSDKGLVQSNFTSTAGQTFDQTITDTATVSDQVTVTKFILDTTDLEIYWKFDETSGGFKNSNITNIFPDGNSTTETGTFNKTVTGIIGTAWKSPPTLESSKVLTGGTPSDYDFFTGGNSTINMWVKTKDCEATVVWANVDTATPSGVIINPSNCGTTTNLQVRYFDNGAEVSETAPDNYWSSDETFDMYTIVHDNTNDLVIWYKNGTLLETDPTSATDLSSATADQTPYLWNNNNPVVAYNNATFDEWSFWSRALSATDISNLYNNGFGLELDNQTLAVVFNQAITDTATVSDQVTVNKIAIWQLVEHDVQPSFNVQHGFRAFNNVLESNSADSDVIHIDLKLGDGLVFKVFNKTNIVDKDIILNAEGFRFGSTSLITTNMFVTDGAYDRFNSTQFPSNANRISIGAGTLGFITSPTHPFSLRNLTLVESNIDYGISTEDFVTLFIRIGDGQGDTSARTEIHSLQIGNTTKGQVGETFYNFTNPTVVFTETEANQSENGTVTVTCTGDCLFLIPPLPNPPENATSISRGYESVFLDWDHDGITVTNFTISRESPIGGGFSFIANTSDTYLETFTTEFLDTNNNLSLNGSTQYNYQICAVNGLVVETTCTTTVVTTPPESTTWQIREQDGGTGGVRMQASTNGFGTNDGIRLSSTPNSSFGRDAWYVWKSFNVTEEGIRDSDLIVHWDLNKISGTPDGFIDVRVCESKFTGFNDTIWADNAFPLCDKFITANSIRGTPAPSNNRLSFDWNAINEFVTVIISLDDFSSSANYQIDIKNVTWTNQTTYDFTGLIPAITMNYSDTNDLGAVSGSFECDLGVNSRQVSSAESCDAGGFTSVKSSVANTEFILAETNEDWQYRELNSFAGGNPQNAYIHFNNTADGFEILSRVNGFGQPIDGGQGFLFKVFNATDIIGKLIQVGWDGKLIVDGAGIDGVISVFNGTLFRWNGTQFETNVLLSNPINGNEEIDVSTRTAIPFASKITNFTVANVPSETLVTLVIELDDSESTALNTDGVISIQNVTVDGTFYNFKNAVQQDEVGNNSGTPTPTDISQRFGSNADRGLVAPSQIIIPQIFNQTELDTVTVSDQTDITAIFNQTETDVVSVIDQTELSIDKSVTDTVSVIDDVNATKVVLIFNQTEIDTAIVIDQEQFDITKLQTDTATVNDQEEFVITKLFSDIATILDAETITKNPVPNAINDLSAFAVGNSCELTWSTPITDPLAPVNGYGVFSSVDGGLFITIIANTSSTDTAFNHTGLNALSTYLYNVTAFNKHGTSLSSNIDSCVPQAGSDPPSIPTGLTAVNQGENVFLDWDHDGVGNPTGFKIERAVGGGAFFDLVADTGDSSTNFLDNTVVPATDFRYRISAINAFGTSDPSGVASITTLFPPAQPTLTAVQVGDMITLTWTEPTSDEPINGYTIDKRINFGSLSTLVANTSSTSLTFDDLNVTKPNTYGYRVNALSILGAGTVSNIVDVVFGSHTSVLVQEQDGSGYKGGGTVRLQNSTFTLDEALDSTSIAIFDNLDSGNYNFTFIDADNYILNKTFNFPHPTGNLSNSFTISALVFDVDCPSAGTGTDVRIKVNYTDGKDITEYPATPVCDSTDKVSWSVRWQGDAGVDMSTMIADFISNNFKANADAFFVSSIQTDTSYDSGLNQIQSVDYVVNNNVTTTDVTINFDLFLGEAPPSGGSGGSGGGGAPPAGASIPELKIELLQRLTGLSVLSRTHQFASAGDVIEGSISVEWEGEDPLNVKSIQLGEFSDIIRFELPPFGLEQKIEGSGDFAMSSAEIPYIITLPPFVCDQLMGITQNCIDEELLSIPIGFVFESEGVDYTASTNVMVDLRPIPFDLPQFQIILLGVVLIVSAIAGNFIRMRIRGTKPTSRGSSRGRTKKFKKKFDSS